MNKTEAAYAWVLEAQKLTGEILSYKFGVITLRIGDDCRYTPDFFVVNKELCLELHEVKGFMRDDALVKIKAAAARYPFVFKVARLQKGQWTMETIKP
jgi:hypothetical protein